MEPEDMAQTLERLLRGAGYEVRRLCNYLVIDPDIDGEEDEFGSSVSIIIRLRLEIIDKIS